jgi:RHS repeat-associated protein
MGTSTATSVSDDLWTMTIRGVDCSGYPSARVSVKPRLRPAKNDASRAESQQYFYHPDHLGSSSFVTDAAGLVEQHMQYLPFGELFVNQQNSTYDTRYKFSAKELDPETNYTYFGARYYDSDLSVWLSVDPMSDKYPNLSPYMYVAGNPLNYTDPNGDTIRPSKALMANRIAYKGYLIFMSSNAGKRFQRLYGEGGRYYHISVVFDIDENEEGKGRTDPYIVNNSGEEREAKTGDVLQEGELWRFKIIVSPKGGDGQRVQVTNTYGADGSGDGAYERPGVERAILRSPLYFIYAETYLHEDQHVRLMTFFIEANGYLNRHPVWQHKMMKNESGEYYNERMEFFHEYQEKYNLPFRREIEYDPNNFENY